MVAGSPKLDPEEAGVVLPEAGSAGGSTYAPGGLAHQQGPGREAAAP